MTDRIQNAGTEVVEAKAGAGSATLSMVLPNSLFPPIPASFWSSRSRFQGLSSALGICPCLERGQQFTSWKWEEMLDAQAIYATLAVVAPAVSPILTYHASMGCFERISINRCVFTELVDTSNDRRSGGEGRGLGRTRSLGGSPLPSCSQTLGFGGRVGRRGRGVGGGGIFSTAVC